MKQQTPNAAAESLARHWLKVAATQEQNANTCRDINRSRFESYQATARRECVRQLLYDVCGMDYKAAVAWETHNAQRPF